MTGTSWNGRASSGCSTRTGSAESAWAQLREQLATTSTQIAEAEVKLDRYFEAFESGAMPKDACGPRIAALSAEIERLRAEACALEHDLDSSGSEPWTDQDLADLEETVRAEAAVEDLQRRRTLVRNLVAEVRVERDGRCLRPRFMDSPEGSSHSVTGGAPSFTQ